MTEASLTDRDTPPAPPVRPPSTTPDEILVSVIMAAYNAGPYLEPSIESLLRQTIDPRRMEVIIVDDGSTDGTGQELDRLAAAHPRRLRVVHQPNSGGPAAPRNVGLDMARGTYVFFLDADDYLGSEALERLVAYAEEHDSDVVLGRMKGIGGRGVPISMYKHNDPDADLFESRVYWTLNAGKLYRRELIDRLQMRFFTDMPNGSDQPFTARAYLNARRISVLADYDFYHAVLRGDGRHVTLSGGAESRVLLLERTTGIVAEHLEPGPKRDALMLRHFRVDMTHLLNHLAREANPELQGRLFARIKAMVDAYYTDRIDDALDPLRRLRYQLVRRGMLDKLIEVYRFWSSKQPHRILVEGDRAFAAYPFFRDPEIGLPDSVFDTTSRLTLRHHLSAGRLSPEGVLHVAGHAYIERVDHADAAYELVLRRRSDQAEHRIAAERTPTPAGAVDDGAEMYDYARVGFEATADVRQLVDGSPLAPGTWDLFVAVSIEGVSKTGRLGSRRDPGVESQTGMKILPGASADQAPIVVTTYYTRPLDNLSLYVGEDRHPVEGGIHVERVSWLDRGVLGISGKMEIDDLPSDALSLRLTTADGLGRKIPIHHRQSAFAARLPVRALPVGDWTVEIVLQAHGGHWRFGIPRPKGVPGRRWIRFGLPRRASVVGRPSGWVLRVIPIDPVGAARRRVSGLLRGRVGRRRGRP